MPRLAPSPLALLLLLAASPLVAQTPEFAGQISVELVNVEVRVVDRDGHPVAGLPRDAFRLFDGDREVAISHFAWVPSPAKGAGFATADAAEGASVAPAEPRQLAILFDELQVGERSRRPLLDALREQLAIQLGPKDRVSVVRFDGANLDVLLQPSTDRRRLARALDELESFSLNRVAATQELRTWIEYLRSDIFNDTGRRFNEVCTNVGQLVQGYADTVKRNVEASAGAMLRIAQRLSYEPGRRLLLHISEGIPLVAGGEAYELALQMCSGSAAAQGVPGARSTNEDPSGEFQSDRFNPRSGALEATGYQMASLWTDVAARLNVLGVTTYTIQAAEAGSAFLSGIEGEIVPTSVRSMATQNPVDTLELVARETGGLLLQAGRGADEEIARLMDDLGGYYSLAFAPDPQSRPGVRAIRVEVARDGVRLRHRQSYRMQTRDERISGQLAELFEAERIDNPLQLRLDVTRAAGAAQQRLRVVVPFDQLSMIASPAGGQEGRFTVYIALRRESGRVLPPRQRAITAQRADPKALAYTYEVELPDERGDVAVAVVDEYSGAVSFARRRLVTR
jgi:VWFA-related protein